ncbi:DUF4365 domain-containing protein [Microbacterium enclense]|uniref:DUF4365 domain-containing protein n=1 Tax=Microbacterium enclense TaxID=993073 RepID=UPI0036DEBDBF
MKQSQEAQLGEYGEDCAVVFFTGIGWGPLRTNKQDLGTDLFVQLRTDDLTDLRMLLGVQVKTGPSWFKEPGRVGGRDGWWYRETDKRHAEYWANHHVPHILVLQSADMATRSWVALDQTTIQDTGLGMKVFVPADQALNASWKPHWIELVAEARKLLSFEGSRWTFSITQVPEEAWARYALLVPRLVVPHPNRGYESDINWAEAIASCADGAPHQWERFAELRSEVPNGLEAFTHESQGWRLASAIGRWVTGDASGLEEVDDSGFPPHLVAARVICASTAALDRYDVMAAAELLEREHRPGEVSADQVWIGVHLAHVRRLQGDLVSAKSMLEDLLSASSALTLDITTSALRSACVLGLFDLAPVHGGDVGSAVTAADNSASWWRTHSVAYGLEADAKKRFKKWAGDRSIVFGGTSSAHNDLFSAAFTARMAGDFGSWRSYTSLLAQTDLTTPPEGDYTAATSLDSLRQVGDAKTLTLVVRKVRSDGPLGVLAELADDVTPEHATSVSIHADLELLAEAGAHFSEKLARPWIDLLIEALSAPDKFYRKYGIRHWAYDDMFSALHGLSRHLTAADQATILAFAASLADDTSQLLERPLSRLLHNFEPSILDEQLAEFDTEATPASWPRQLFRDLLAPRSERVRKVVRDAILRGDLTALSGANDVTMISDDEAVVLLAECRAVFDQYKQPSNGVAMGGQDYYRLSTVLALKGPEATRDQAWDVTIEALMEPVDVPERKHNALRIVARSTNAVPARHSAALESAARRLRAAPPSQYADSRMGLAPIRPVLDELLLELNPRAADWNALLATLLAGDSASRRSASNVLARRAGYETTLLALTHDSDRDVAVQAVRGLAQRVAMDADLPASYLQGLLRLAEEAGEAIPFAMIGGLSEANDLNERAKELLAALVNHVSPAVKDDAADLVRERGWQVDQPAPDDAASP